MAGDRSGRRGRIPSAAAASEGVGGPVGDHAAPHPWWTPVRVVLAVTTLVFALGMLQKTPCVQADWSGDDVRYAALCYSDVPYLYTGPRLRRAACCPTATPAGGTR